VAAQVAQRTFAHAAASPLAEAASEQLLVSDERPSLMQFLASDETA
jgi:hypothetical protein